MKEGTIVLLGGSRQASDDWDSLLREFAAQSTGDGTVKLVMEPTSTRAIEAAAKYLNDRVGIEVERTHDPAADLRCSLIYVFGGNPADYARRLRATPEGDALLRALSRGASIVATSAGAEALGGICRDLAVGSMDADGYWLDGLGLVPGAFIATHFDSELSDDAEAAWRSAFNSALAKTVPPAFRFVGIDERTGLIGDGKRWRVTGRGCAHVHAGNDEWQHFSATEEFAVGPMDAG